MVKHIFTHKHITFLLIYFIFHLPECPMKKFSCNATIMTEDTEADSFNKLIELNDVYTQAECGGN